MVSDNIKGFVLAAIVFSLFLYGYRYYEYSQNDPDFCASCHVIQDSFLDIQLSRHKDVICQKCHEIGIIEQNKRLGIYLATGKNPISLAHGRATPWQKCSSCHEEAISQGAVAPTKSYGHAKHVLNKKIECKVCHIRAKHSFKPDETVCLKCHGDREVHGLTIDDFSCLKCHRYSKREIVLTPRKQCTICHPGLPEKGTMATFSCHYCHRPHSRELPTSRTCTLECHRSQLTLGQHGAHSKKGIDCMLCHKPHTWTVKEKTQSLCRQCHAYKDPRSFVYIF
ncbi:MAG TPA: cytochrome c3 family protein [Dissulfurispiraceae bacterium]|nr:cytochrome c3 family protein [Dissulfurispiraceae bacterium]